MGSCAKIGNLPKEVKEEEEEVSSLVSAKSLKSCSHNVNSDPSNNLFAFYKLKAAL